MNISLYDTSTFINDEVKRYAEVISKNIYRTKICVKDRYDHIRIKFDIHKLNYNLFLVINRDGEVYFLIKDKHITFRIKSNTKKLIIAEWNDFADPFEVALTIQTKMYEIIKSYIMRDNSYDTKYGVCSDIDKEIFEDFKYYDDDDEDDYDESYAYDNRTLEDVLSIHEISIDDFEEVFPKSEPASLGFEDIIASDYLDIFDSI